MRLFLFPSFIQIKTVFKHIRTLLYHFFFTFFGLLFHTISRSPKQLLYDNGVSTEDEDEDEFDTVFEQEYNDPLTLISNRKVWKLELISNKNAMRFDIDFEDNVGSILSV